MSQPPGYTQSTDFSQEEANGVAGRSTVRTAALDAELSAVESTLDAILFNLALIQRDDTQLGDRVVKIHSLYDDIRALLALAGTNPRGDWVTATAYAAKDVVSQGTGTYVCVTAHTSGVFATDLAADKWIVIFDSVSYVAAGIVFTPTGGIAATNVQAALAEIDSEAAKKAANLSDLANAATARTNLSVPSNAEAVLQTVVDAKGDILVGTAADTVTRKAVGSDGYNLQAQSGAADGLQYLPPGNGFSLINGNVDWTVAGNALTCAIKGWDGNDPSATNPVYALIRSATATTGLPTLAKLTAATSVTVSSGSTLGTRNAIPSRVWAVLFDDAGTYRLGVINCLTTVAGAGSGSDVTAIYPLSGWGIASSTAEGGAGAADSAQTFYTGTAVASKPYAVLGFATFEAGQAAAGTWATAASRKQLWGQGAPLPGAVIQAQRANDQAVTTTSTILPLDDTIPQNTEGAQTVTVAITPSSAANVLRVEAVENFGSDASAGVIVGAAIFQDATANALSAVKAYNGAASNWEGQLRVLHDLLAGATASTTFKLRAGPQTANTVTFNGRSAGRIYGGVLTSFITATEIMA